MVRQLGTDRIVAEGDSLLLDPRDLPFELVRRLVELCQDLKIRTVAEMVETAEVEEVVRKAGVDFAQGWLFGKPADQPQPALKIGSVTPAARRAGVSEGWG